MLVHCFRAQRLLRFGVAGGKAIGNTFVRSVGASAVVMFSVACGDALPPEPDGTDFRQVTGSTAGNVWIGAGDIADCGTTNDEATADLVDSLLLAHPLATVFTAGDNVYPNGSAQEYADCYEPSWGRFKDNTWATLGNHEYDLGNATPTFDYFGSRAGPRDLGYYSLDQGNWHIVMLNSGSTSAVPMAVGSAQEQWLRADLAANTKSCVMAVIHHPRFFSCQSSSPSCSFVSNPSKPLWNALHEYGAELIIAGHRHHYERFALQDPDGNADPVSGIRQIIVGTGGKSVSIPDVIAPNSEVVNDERSFGVIKLTLNDNSYDWEFVPIPGVSFTDAGSGTCSGPVPIADFTWSENPVRTVTFTDASTDLDGTLTAWAWAFGDGTTSTVQNPTHTYAAGGTYTVTLTVTDNDGNTGTTTKSVTVGARPPVADFTYSATELNATFTDASVDPDGSVVGWSWDFGDGNGSTARNPVHTYGVRGSYTVTLTVTDDDGLSGTVSHTVTVAGPDPGTVIYVTAANSSGSAGGVSFADEDIIAYDVSTGTWSMFFDGSDVGLAGSNDKDIDAFTVLPNGDVLFSIKSLTTIPDVGTVDDNDIIRFTGTTGPNTSGTFSLYLNGTSAGLAGEDIDAIGFAPDGRLVVSLTGTFSVPGVSGADDDLIALDPGGTSWTMYFDGSDAFLGSTPDEDVTGVFISPTTGDIYLTTVGAFDVPGVSGGASDIFLCMPISLGENTSCTYASYWVGSLHGLSGIDVIGIHIDEGQAAPNAMPTASFTYVATNLQVSFTDVSTDPDGMVVGWSWNFGDGSAVSTARNPSHTYGAAGTYVVTLTVTDNDGATDDFSQSVTVSASNTPPAASFTFTTSNLRADFTDTSTDSDGSVVAWNWSFGDGQTSTSRNPSHTYSAAGTYTVTLTVTDNAGATHAQAQSVTVSSPPAAVSVTGLSPNTVALGASVVVVISGSGFVAGASVSFENGSGPAPTASNVVVIDPNTIRTTIETRNAGPKRDRVWDVRVTNSGGSTAALAGGLTITVAR